MFDLIVFDCDGVLVDSEVLAGEALRALYRAEGTDVSAELYASIVGMKTADALDAIERSTGGRLPPERHAELWPATRALFAERLQAMADVTELLRRSAAPRCVASSSSPERIRFSLGATGLIEFFERDRLFSGYEVEHGKPAPDLFLLAAGRCGVEPERCLVIEDTRYGIMGAKAAGMTAFGFTGGSHHTPSGADTLREAGADWVATSMEELAARLGI
ncbi:HAD family phosphatase [Aureimonas sp. ME7]|uniref:HAD family hydrolase n=1 Tax=Aureimonas sp. ME7 TaxID=2744252 RepID=UPI0015F590D7|nr:HAD family phosphatase [Aureimonas sp. ME7]